jgi:DNA-directed RNA polymerase beta' subunit
MEQQRIYKMREQAINSSNFRKFNWNWFKPIMDDMSILPVIPPALRPMIQLEGGRFATSDLK